MNYDEKEKSIEEMSENEIDPRLRFDAFMGGVKDGGLRSVTSINLLVSYLVANMSGKVTAAVITQAMAEGELANHFEVTNAIANLQKSGVIIADENGALSLTTDTKADIELIEKDLPYTVRERSIHLCQKIMAKETYRRENLAEIVKTDDAYTVMLGIGDNRRQYMRLNLFAASMDQAEMIKEKFISNPAKVYQTLIDAIFANEE